MNSLAHFSKLFTPTRRAVTIPARTYATKEVSTKELADRSGLPEEYVKDGHLHILMLRVDNLLKKLNVTEEKAQKEFLAKYLISLKNTLKMVTSTF
eukprot:TRINITY_DN4429_c0_g1_i1.p1 TRINITY_DN4429_c0_g1~~TRINITY_DN4429_c0_g1_i1.p1  ORF type:complete len:96 (-),score=32.25 TRINITY_DN4429_c0_g1_i1:273-560(-)